MFMPTIERVSADARGEIYSVSLPGDQELMLLHSWAGSLRGGHSHDVSEVVVLLTGAMRYYKKMSADAPETYELLHGGDVSFNQKGQFHLGEFVADTWLLEWKIGTSKTGWKNLDHAPYRERVRVNAAG